MLLLDWHIVQPNTNKNENDVMDQQRYDNDTTGAAYTRIALIKKLSQICISLAIPIRGEETGLILAYALVGQGGLVQEKKNKPRDVGSQNPIYISVGHNISLHDRSDSVSLLFCFFFSSTSCICNSNSQFSASNFCISISSARCARSRAASSFFH
jgi:hypothetical protein